jgi:hypothetical protein
MRCSRTAAGCPSLSRRRSENAQEISHEADNDTSCRHAPGGPHRRRTGCRDGRGGADARDHAHAVGRADRRQQGGHHPGLDRPRQASGQLRREEPGPAARSVRRREAAVLDRREEPRAARGQAQRGRQGDAEEVPQLPHRRLPVAPHRELPPVRDREHEEERGRRVQDDQERPGHRGLLCRPAVPVPEERQRGDVEPAAEVRHHRVLLGRHGRPSARSTTPSARRRSAPTRSSSACASTTTNRRARPARS